MTLHELDTVVLDRDLPARAAARDVGAVVPCTRPGAEVEFVRIRPDLRRSAGALGRARRATTIFGGAPSRPRTAGCLTASSCRR
jgi:hypothetical protein